MQRPVYGYVSRETPLQQRIVDKILVVVARGGPDMGKAEKRSIESSGFPASG